MAISLVLFAIWLRPEWSESEIRWRDAQQPPPGERSHAGNEVASDVISSAHYAENRSSSFPSRTVGCRLRPAPAPTSSSVGSAAAASLTAAMSTSSRGRSAASSGAPVPAPPAPSPRRRRRRLDADPRSVGGEPPLRVREAGVARLLGEAAQQLLLQSRLRVGARIAGAAALGADATACCRASSASRARALARSRCTLRYASSRGRPHLQRPPSAGWSRAPSSASSSTKSAFGRIVAAGLRRSHVRRRSSSAGVSTSAAGAAAAAGGRASRRTRAPRDHAAFDETADALEEVPADDAAGAHDARMGRRGEASRDGDTRRSASTAISSLELPLRMSPVVVVGALGLTLRRPVYRSVQVLRPICPSGHICAFSGTWAWRHASASGLLQRRRHGNRSHHHRRCWTAHREAISRARSSRCSSAASSPSPPPSRSSSAGRSSTLYFPRRHWRPAASACGQLPTAAARSPRCAASASCSAASPRPSSRRGSTPRAAATPTARGRRARGGGGAGGGAARRRPRRRQDLRRVHVEPRLTLVTDVLVTAGLGDVIPTTKACRLFVSSTRRSPSSFARDRHAGATAARDGAAGAAPRARPVRRDAHGVEGGGGRRRQASARAQHERRLLHARRVHPAHPLQGKLSEEDIEECRATFRELDLSGDGTLSALDFELAVQQRVERLQERPGSAGKLRRIRAKRVGALLGKLLRPQRFEARSTRSGRRGGGAGRRVANLTNVLKMRVLRRQHA